MMVKSSVVDPDPDAIYLWVINWPLGSGSGYLFQSFEEISEINILSY